MRSSDEKKNNSKKTKINLIWRKSEKPVNSAAFLINGKAIVFIACSIISAFINLVFITNLTKSAYTIGTLLSVPAAVLLGLMSIGLDLSKCLHAVQVNTLNELYRKLSDRPWAKKIKNVSKKWFTVYILYVILSVITSMSLSTISIGAGITRNANTLKQIDKQIANGEKYVTMDSTAENITIQNIVNSATDTSDADALEYARVQTAKVIGDVEEYKAERTAFKKAFGNDSIGSNDPVNWEWRNGKGYTDTKTEVIPTEYWDDRNASMSTLLKNAGYKGRLSGQAFESLDETSIMQNIKTYRLSTTKDSSKEMNNEKLDEFSNKTVEKAYGWLETLNTIGLVNPTTGETLQLEVDYDKSSTVQVQKALAALEALRVAVQNDSGDIGSSSKIFMQLGSALEGNKNEANTDLTDVLNKKASGSFGSTEIMMMGMLLFLSLLCELAINQFSPKTNISRKMLDQFSQYFDPDFDVNDFMLDVYIEQFNYGRMTKAQFDKSVKETLEMMKVSKKDLVGVIDNISDPLINLKKLLGIKPPAKVVKEPVIKPVVSKADIVGKPIVEVKPVVEAKPVIEVKAKVEPVVTPEVKKEEPVKVVAASTERPIREVKVDDTELKLERLNKALNSFESDLEEK